MLRARALLLFGAALWLTSLQRHMGNAQHLRVFYRSAEEETTWHSHSRRTVEEEEPPLWHRTHPHHVVHARSHCYWCKTRLVRSVTFAPHASAEPAPSRRSHANEARNGTVTPRSNRHHNDSSTAGGGDDGWHESPAPFRVHAIPLYGERTNRNTVSAQPFR